MEKMMEEISGREKKVCETCKGEGTSGCKECGGWGWYWVRKDD